MYRVTHEKWDQRLTENSLPSKQHLVIQYLQEVYRTELYIYIIQHNYHD